MTLQPRQILHLPHKINVINYFTKLLLYESMTLRIYYFTNLLLYWCVSLRIYYFTNSLLYELITLRIYDFTNLLLYESVSLSILKVRNSEVSHPNFLWWIQVMSSIMAIIFNLRYDSTKKAPQKRRTECQRLHNSLRACHVTYFQSNQVSWVAAACFCILHDARMSRHLGSKAETRPTGHYPGLLDASLVKLFQITTYIIQLVRVSMMIAWMPSYNHLTHDHVKNDGIRYRDTSVSKQKTWERPA